MKLSRLFCCSVGVGVIGGVLVVATIVLRDAGFITAEAGLTFVSFIAWSCYFYSGATPKNAGAAWLSLAVGILCAICVFQLWAVFTRVGLDADYLALPLAVTIGIVPMNMAERLPFGNQVPSVYLGGATYFAIMSVPAAAAKGYLAVAAAELAYAALGLFAGYLNMRLVAHCKGTFLWRRFTA